MKGEYKEWRKFNNVINKAIIACKTSNNRLDDHFANVGKTIKMPNGASKLVDDYKLSRYACYLLCKIQIPILDKSLKELKKEELFILNKEEF